MNGPHATGQEYTGKHRRDEGRGLAGPLRWGGRAEPSGRPITEGRTVPGAAPLPGPGGASRPGLGAVPMRGLRAEPGPWSDAG
jgi:hypothetical protein